MKILRILVDCSKGLAITVASCALFALMCLTFFDVILRSAFNLPIEAATELTRILMAIMVFSVLPLISVSGEQIAVDLADGWFARLRLTRLRDSAILLITGAALIWPALRIQVLALRARDYGEMSEYLSIPAYLIGIFIFASVAVTAGAMLIAGLVRLFWGDLKTEEQI